MSKPAPDPLLKPVSAIARVVAGFIAGVVSVAAQYLALWSLFHRWRDVDPFVLFIVIQVVAGMAQAIAFRAFLPVRYRVPRGGSIVLLWLMCTFVPVFGGLVVLVSTLWTAWFPGETEGDELVDVPRPEFVNYLMARAYQGDESRIQARLANTEVPAAERLSALVAIQGMPTRTTGALLRELLADPVEDIRLIAYGTLDQAENDIMQKIFLTVTRLEEAEDDAERHALNRRLAELHFELVYQNLVQGAVYRHTLDQADKYAQTALATDETDAALWLIRGRLALAKGLPGDAESFLTRAQELGFPRERLTPWLAEVAYLKGDYSLVSKMLRSLGNAAALPTLKPVVSYWT
jgi:polysaccharide biosynthesis protein PelE